MKGYLPGLAIRRGGMLTTLDQTHPAVRDRPTERAAPATGNGLIRGPTGGAAPDTP